MRPRGYPAGGTRLVGRHQEIEELIRVLESSSEEGGIAIAVVGEAGIGKSRLVDEALRSADVAPVLNLHCAEHSLGPLVDLMPLLRALFGPREAMAMLGEEAVTHAGSDKSAGQKLLLLAGQVVSSLEENPRVLVVEDLHWASQQLVMLLGFVLDGIRTLRRPGVCVLIVSRTLPPDHHAEELLTLAARMSGSVRIDLETLPPEATAELVRQRVPSASVRYLDLIEQSGQGVPLRVLAAVDVLARAGVDGTVDNGDMTADGRLDLLGVLANDPVAEWLKALVPETRSLLGCLGALGGEVDAAFGSDFLKELVRRGSLPGNLSDEHVVETSLAAAVSMGVLAHDGSSFRFLHPHYRSLLYESLSDAQRRVAHRVAADLLLMRRSDQRVAGALGNHLLRSEHDELSIADADLLITSARECVSVGGWANAAEMLEQAVRLLPLDARDTERAQLTLEAAEARYFNHDQESAQENYADAVRLARTVGDEASLASAVIGLARIEVFDADAYRSSTTPGEVDRFLREATDPLSRARVLQIAAETKANAGESDSGAELAQEALALFEKSGGTDADFAWCHFAASYAELARLDLDKSIEFGLTAVSYAGADWYARVVASSRTAIAAFGAGRTELAEELAAESVAISSTSHDHSGAAFGNIVLCGLAELAGDDEEARRLLDLAELSSRRSRHAAAALHVVPMTLARLIREGNVGAARSILESWPGLPRRVTAPYRTILDDLDGDTGALRAHRGPRLLETWMATGVLAPEIELAIRRADEEWLGAVVPYLRALIARGQLFSLAHPASLHRLLGEVLVSQSQLDAAIEVLDEGAAICRGVDAHLERARLLLLRARAESVRAGGSADLAREAALEAARLAEELGDHDLEDAARLLGAIGIDRAVAAQERGKEWKVVVFTDMVGSTYISHRYTDRTWRRLVDAEFDIVHEVSADHGGTHIDDAGDGIFYWFPDAEAAADAALSIQNRVGMFRSTGPALRVRVCLAGGSPPMRNGRPYGSILNRSAKLSEISGAGDVVADEAVCELLADRVSEFSTVEIPGVGVRTIGWLHRSTAQAETT